MVYLVKSIGYLPEEDILFIFFFFGRLQVIIRSSIILSDLYTTFYFVLPSPLIGEKNSF